MGKMSASRQHVIPRIKLFVKIGKSRISRSLQQILMKHYFINLVDMINQAVTLIILFFEWKNQKRLTLEISTSLPDNPQTLHNLNLVTFPSLIQKWYSNAPPQDRTGPPSHANTTDVQRSWLQYYFTTFKYLFLFCINGFLCNDIQATSECAPGIMVWL